MRGRRVKAILCIFALMMMAATGRAYERLQGPTQVTYWDRTQTYGGYTLFAAQGETYLVDMEGRVAHTWTLGINPRLLANGDLLDATNGNINGFTGFQEVDWNGSNVWQYAETRTNYFPHHDFVRIYNPKLGSNTTLYIASKAITSSQCIAAGCNPATSDYTHVTVDAIVEVDASGAVVWEWCFFDHGIQDCDASKSNYVGQGMSISNYPGRLNLNLPGWPLTNDWLHCTSIDYNTNLDQIVISAAAGEFYVIDHGNTFLAGNPAGSRTLAAATNGDFRYRFGDPARYGQGSPPSITLNWTVSTTGNKQIGGLSQVAWVPAGIPGAGHFLVFNNGQDLFETTPQSYIFEVNGCLNAGGSDTGTYVNPPNAGYSIWSPPGHDTDKQKKNLSRQVVSTYMSMANQAFFSHTGGSVQRLGNSNLLVCSAAEGHFFEVTPASNVVWEYINPVMTNGIQSYKRDRWPLDNASYRATRYRAEDAALSGRLTPGTNTMVGGLPSYISAPAISGTTRSPLQPSATNAVVVSASITNNRVVASAALSYVTGGVSNTVVMTGSGSVYRASIPACAAGTVVSYAVSAADDFDNLAVDATYSYTVQSGVTNLPPVIGSLVQAPAAPTHADGVTITALATDAVGIASVTLTYTLGAGGTTTNTAFSESMATNAINPWAGAGCDNAWAVAYKSANPFQQAANSNYGSGNTNGLTFKGGTTNLFDSTITTLSGIRVPGSSATLTFYLQASVVGSNAAWAMQLNPGTGFTTRLAGQTPTNQSWQLYSYTLQSGDLVSNLLLRFAFSEGNISNRIFLDQIMIQSVASGSIASNLAMILSSDNTYAAQIPAQTNGAAVSYVVTVLDSSGLSAATGGSYQVSDAGAYPLAAFTAAPATGGAPLAVSFSDTSAGVITNRCWVFGDGQVTNTQAVSLMHSYCLPGTSTVHLIVAGPLGISTNIRAGLIAAVSVDSVGDGIPDWWRAWYFGGNGGSTNGQSCAAADPDGDGMTNWQEYQCDTDPTDPTSRLAIVGFLVQTNVARLAWVGGVAATQLVECRPGLADADGLWTPRWTNLPPTALTSVLWIAGAGSNGFCRVRAWR